MKFSDEQIMAYADGELDGPQAQAITEAMALDTGLAAQVDAHRALRANVFAAFAPILDEPVPVRLQALVSDGKVVLLRRRWVAQEWGALAAMLVLAVAVGRASLQQGDIAQGALDSALSQQAAADGGAVRIGLSFVNKAGRYCRSFSMADGAGLACRDGAAWRVGVRIATPPDSQGPALRMAASAIPPAVLDAIDGQIAGAPFDAAAERQAIKAGWR